MRPNLTGLRIDRPSKDPTGAAELARLRASLSSNAAHKEAINLVRGDAELAESALSDPLTGLRSTVFGGSCLVAGAVLAGFRGPWPVWAGLFVLGTILALRRGR